MGRRRVTMLLAVVVAALAGSVIWSADLLGIRTTSPVARSVGSVFDDPPPYPGYAWTKGGRAVADRELTTIAGPGHCDWQTATMLFIGWPPGTAAMDGSQQRQYVRDPRGDISGRDFQRLLVTRASLPADARATGYRYGAIELYLSPSDQDEAIYVVSATDVERWPRSDPMTLCV